MENPQFNLNHFTDENNNWRLQVVSNNKDFFEKILKQADEGRLNDALESEIKTASHKRLYEVFKSIWSYVGDLNAQQAKEYLSILNKMVLMWLEEKDSGKAIRMFQTVNDRGVPLLILDKLKALLILYSNKYCEGKLDNTINERFGDIFKIVTEIRKHKLSASIADKDFAKEVEARIFNYHALGQEDIGDYKHGSDESYRKLKDLLKNKIKEKDFEDLCQWLNLYSNDLLNFFKAFLDVMKKTETSIEAFKTLFVLKINPYFYSSLVRLEMNEILDDECLKLFAKAEIFFYGLNSTNDSSAYKLYQFSADKNEFKEKVVEFCKKCSKGKYRNLQEAIDNLALDVYNQKKIFHYLFLSYRCSDMDIHSFIKLLEDKKTYNHQEEHIVPQNASENGSLHQYEFKDKSEFDELKDTFGNLLVLEISLNSSSQDSGLAKKQESYKQSNIFYNNKFANSEDFLSFNKERIKKENEKFTLWAREFFKEFI